MTNESHIDLIDEFIGLDGIERTWWLHTWIEARKEEEITNFLNRLEASLPRNTLIQSQFRVFGGAELSGLGVSCSEFECRSNGLLRAASFATFYSDELGCVVI